MKKLILFVLFLSIANAASVTVHIDFSYYDYWNYSVEVNAGETVLDVFNKSGEYYAGDKTNFDISYTDGRVYQVNDTAEDASEGTYWKYFANRIVGLTDTPSDGDLLELIYMNATEIAVYANNSEYNACKGANVYLNNSAIETIFIGKTNASGVLKNTTLFLRNNSYTLTLNKSGRTNSTVFVVERGVGYPSKEIHILLDTTASNDAYYWLISHQNASSGQVVITDPSYWINKTYCPNLWEDCPDVWGTAHYAASSSLVNNPESSTKALGFLKNYKNASDAGFGMGFGSDPDITAWAVMAFVSNNKVGDLFSSNITSIDYLKSTQKESGGFALYSEIDTTPWVMLGFIAADYDLPSKNGNTSIDYLLNTQTSGGSWTGCYNGATKCTLQMMLALGAVGVENASTTKALSYLKGLRNSTTGCFADSYENALASMVFSYYNNETAANEARDCLRTLQFDDGGFSRSPIYTPTNPTDTVFALIALNNGKLPLVKLDDSQGPNVSVTFSKPAWNNVLLQANTSEPAICKYSVNSAEVYDSMHFFSSTGAKTHLTQVTLGEGGPYTLFVYCKDISGNRKTNAAHTDPFNINVPPSPPSSGGGGGGGGGSWSGTAGHGESHLISRIVANEPHPITINTENYSVYELEITPLNDLRNVRLTVELLTERPRSIALEPEGVVYKYLEISWTGLSDEHIADAKIRFKLSKDWLAANNYEDKHAVLWRGADNTWVRLPTYEIDEEDYWYKYYEAKTLWFSPFVVTLTDIEYTEPEEETAAEEESEVVEEAPETQETAPGTGITGLVAGEGGFNIDPVLVLLLFALVGAVLIYFNVIVKIRESKDLT